MKCLLKSFFTLTVSLFFIAPISEIYAQGIKTYRKEIHGIGVFPLKGVMILDAPIDKVLTLMLDDDRAPEWIDLLAGIKLIKTYSDRRYTLLYEMDSPLPLIVKKRDFLLESNFTYHKKNRY